MFFVVPLSFSFNLLGFEVLSGGHSLIWSFPDDLSCHEDLSLANSQSDSQLTAESSHGEIWDLLVLVHIPQEPSCCYKGSLEEVCFISPKLKIEHPYRCLSHTFLDVFKISHSK